MVQCIALAINARKQPCSSDKIQAFACHPTSHLLLHEHDNFHELLGVQAVIMNPGEKDYDPELLKDRGCYGMDPIRLSHVEGMFDSLDRTNASSSSATLTYPNPNTPSKEIDLSTLILELPHREIGGKLTPWNEVEEISRLCKKHNVHFHCDGARIFEASAGYK